MKNWFDLSGRNAVVTGASSGIGRAIALGLAEYGANVAVNYAPKFDSDTGHEASAESLRTDIENFGRKALLLPVDLSANNAAETLFEAAVDGLGEIDILVLNASVQFPSDFSIINSEQFDMQLNVNYRSSLRLMQLSVPDMADRGWGRLVTIGSTQQAKPHRQMLVYASLKSAIRNSCKLIAREYGRFGVTANNLAPGFIDTDRNDFVRNDPEAWEQVISQIPAGRVGKTEDIVGAALLLSSDAGSFINGVNLDVAGGAQLPR